MSHNAYKGVAYHTMGLKGYRVRSEKKALNKVVKEKSDLTAVTTLV
jgi:hypothetical protein